MMCDDIFQSFSRSLSALMTGVYISVFVLVKIKFWHRARFPIMILDGNEPFNEFWQVSLLHVDVAVITVEKKNSKVFVKAVVPCLAEDFPCVFA